MHRMVTKKPKVFITRSDFPEVGIKLLTESCDLEYFPSDERDITTEELTKKIIGMDGLFIYPKNKINKNLIEMAAKNGLKVISSMSVGLDHIDLEAVRKTSIRIGHTPDVLTESTAELTIAILLAASRRIVEGYHTILRNEWTWTPTWMCGKGLHKSTVGLIGFGRIGQSIAKKLIPFGISQILYSGPRKKIEDEQFRAKFVELDFLLKESDFVIVACPLTSETKGIVSAEKIALMKKSAVFVNIARGGIVDQDALVHALQNKTIAAAGLDVMSPEPIPDNHPLVKLNNCILTPHIAYATKGTVNEMALLTAKNIVAVLTGVEMPAEYFLNK